MSIRIKLKRLLLDQYLWTDLVADELTAKILSVIHSELKGLVEDKDNKYFEKCIIGISGSKCNMKAKIFNQANALWRTKLAEKFEVKG